MRRRERETNENERRKGMRTSGPDGTELLAYTDDRS